MPPCPSITIALMADHTEMLPDPLPAEPLTLAQAWLARAWSERLQPNPNAMVLATTTPEGHPSARVVLCKDIQPTPGFIVFYTNYESRKGHELAANPRAAVVMHWDHLHRQIRIEGCVVKAPVADSDAYFASRAIEEWAYFVEAFSKVREGGGTLLDNMLIYANTDHGDARVHSLNKLVSFTAGRAGGRAKTGLHVDAKETGVTRVGYTALRIMGLELPTWGDKSNMTADPFNEIVA